MINRLGLVGLACLLGAAWPKKFALHLAPERQGFVQLRLWLGCMRREEHHVSVVLPRRANDTCLSHRISGFTVSPQKIRGGFGMPTELSPTERSEGRCERGKPQAGAGLPLQPDVLVGLCSALLDLSDRWHASWCIRLLGV